MPPRNNVTRMLDQHQIAYTPHELPPAKLGALEAAAHLGVTPEQMFKSIVVLRPGRGKPILALVDALSEVDLKALAVAAAEKKLVLASQKEAEARTGLLVGGISPLALLNKGFDAFLDIRAMAHPSIHVSGGQRGLNIQLTPQDLIQLTHAAVGPISRPAA